MGYPEGFYFLESLNPELYLLSQKTVLVELLGQASYLLPQAGGSGVPLAEEQMQHR